MSTPTPLPRLKVVFRGNVVREASPVALETQDSKRKSDSIPTLKPSEAPKSPPPSVSAKKTTSSSSTSSTSGPSADYDKKKIARDVLIQLLASKEKNVTLIPPEMLDDYFKNKNHYAGEVIVPEDKQELLLMIAALKTIGREDALDLLGLSTIKSDSSLSSESTSEPSITNASNESEKIDKKSSTILRPVKLDQYESLITKNACRSAKRESAASSAKLEEDDESLALELELEFTQLSPQTRVELMQQIDKSENEVFNTSGNRMERLRRATREAAFHNVQLSFDRARIGPYYLDPHTQTYQTYHTINLPPPICNATVAHPQNENLTILNPNLPLPRGFCHFKQPINDFHPNLHSQLENNINVSKKLNEAKKNKQEIFKLDEILAIDTHTQKLIEEENQLSQQYENTQMDVDGAEKSNQISSNLNVISKPQNGLESSRNDQKEDRMNSLRYNTMDGYVQWLKKELESHLAFCAPLAPYDTYSSQFRSQWDTLTDRGVFDYYSPSSTMANASNSETFHISQISDLSPSNKHKHISSSFRKVWKEHKTHLQSEHAVQLAMEAADRALKRIKFGDPSDAEIDPSKPLTRDERRKIAKREKEYPKLIELFLSTGLVSPNEYNLNELSWYDLQSLFASLGLSTAVNVAEEEPKSSIIIGPNGKIRPRSHKKGAAKAARLAAKKAMMEQEAAQNNINHQTENDHRKSKASNSREMTSNRDASNAVSRTNSKTNSNQFDNNHQYQKKSYSIDSNDEDDDDHDDEEDDDDDDHNYNKNNFNNNLDDNNNDIVSSNSRRRRSRSQAEPSLIDEEELHFKTRRQQIKQNKQEDEE